MSGARPPRFSVSIVVAAHDEAACLPELLSRLGAMLDDHDGPSEIVVVDDGSRDGTFDVVVRHAALDERIRGVRLSRNEGHQAALLCGMERSVGDVVITLDADLQHPPERIPEMIAAWRRGVDVVHMRREPTSSLRARDLAGRAFYVLHDLLSDVHVAHGSTDFRLLDRRCVEALLSLARTPMFLRAAVRRIGFDQIELPFRSDPRFAGESSYTPARLVSLGAEALASSPRLTLLGGLGALAGTLVCAVALYGFWTEREPSAVVAFVVGGLLAASATLLSVLGSQVRLAHAERATRPAYFVADEVGREPGAPAVAVRDDGERPRDGASTLH